MSFRRLKEIPLASAGIIKNLFTYRHILFQMILREIKGRFAGSVGGMFWSFVHPLLLLAVYLFVFIYIFKLRVGPSSGAGTSAIYIMAGLFPWTIISEGLSRGTTSLLENASLIQKTPFPTEILTAKAVLAPFFSQGVAILLLALYKIIFSASFEIIIFLPVIIFIQFFFTLGIAFLTAAASVFFRDVVQLVQIVISFWIYATPIFYPLMMLPEWAKKVMYFNPLYPVMEIYQSLFVWGKPGNLYMLLYASLWAALFFVSGAFIFTKLKDEFADWL